MGAIGVLEYGGPEALQVLDLPEPHAGEGAVRVHVQAATVNPTDTGLRSGAYGAALEGREPPYVPGADAAGVVDEVGHGVADLALGDVVAALVVPTGPHGGAYAEHVVVPAAPVVRLPDTIDVVRGSTLLMNGLTAHLALEALALAPGQTLAVTGAAGAYGGYVVQLAVADGLRVVADAKPEDEDLVRGFGAHEVVARGDDVADRISEVVPDGVDGLADGAVMDERVLPALRDGGALTTVRGWSGPAERGIRVEPVLVFDAADRHDLLQSLVDRAEDGSLTLRVADVLPADRAVEAHRRLEAGGVRGRLVLDFR